MKIIKVLIICSLNAVLFGAYAQKRLETNQSSQAALKLMGEEKYRQAKVIWSSLIKNNPKNKGFYLDRAACHEELGDWDLAVKDYSMVLKLDPKFDEALFNRAQAHFQYGNHALAIRDIERLLDLPYSETNMIYFKMEEANNGESFTNGITTLSDNRAGLLNFLGKVHLDINDFNGAMDAFNQAIALAQHADFYVSRGVLFEVLRNDRDAQKDYEKALELQPYHRDALYNLANLAEYGGNTLLAISMYDKIIEKEYGFGEAYFSRGYSYFEAGLYKNALSDFHSAIQLGYDDVDVFLNRGLAQQKLKNYDQALSDYNTALDLSPENPDSYAKRASLYFSMREFMKAAEDYTAAIAYRPGEGRFYYNRGVAYYNARDFGNACSDLELALKLGFETARKAQAEICTSD